MGSGDNRLGGHCLPTMTAWLQNVTRKCGHKAVSRTGLLKLHTRLSLNKQTNLEDSMDKGLVGKMLKKKKVNESFLSKITSISLLRMTEVLHLSNFRHSFISDRRAGKYVKQLAS